MGGCVGRVGRVICEHWPYGPRLAPNSAVSRVSSCPSEGLDPSPFDAPSRGLVGWYDHNARPAEARTNLLAAGLRLVPFGAAHKIGFPIFPWDLLHVPATRPKWALSSSPTLPPAYRWAVGLRSCHVARSKRTDLLSRHGILDISASHHQMVYIR
jgi:hypothetical protein